MLSADHILKARAVQALTLPIDPQCLRTGFVQQGLSFALRQQEQGSGQGIGKAGVWADDGNGSPIPAGIQGVWVDDVVIAFALHLIGALVVTTGDDAAG